jgi:hypothetical protein
VRGGGEKLATELPWADHALPVHDVVLLLQRLLPVRDRERPKLFLAIPPRPAVVPSRGQDRHLMTAVVTSSVRSAKSKSQIGIRLRAGSGRIRTPGSTCDGIAVKRRGRAGGPRRSVLNFSVSVIGN